MVWMWRKRNSHSMPVKTCYSNHRHQCDMKVVEKNPEIQLPHDSLTALWVIIAKGLSIILYKYLLHWSSSMFIAVLFIIDRKWRHSCAFIRKPGLTNEVDSLLALLMLNYLVYIVNYINRFIWITSFQDYFQIKHAFRTLCYNFNDIL